MHFRLKCINKLQVDDVMDLINNFETSRVNLLHCCVCVHLVQKIYTGSFDFGSYYGFSSVYKCKANCKLKSCIIFHVFCLLLQKTFYWKCIQPLSQCDTSSICCTATLLPDTLKGNALQRSYIFKIKLDSAQRTQCYRTQH